MKLKLTQKSQKNEKLMARAAKQTVSLWLYTCNVSSFSIYLLFSRRTVRPSFKNFQFNGLAFCVLLLNSARVELY